MQRPGFTGLLPNENLLGITLVATIPFAYLGFRGNVRTGSSSTSPAWRLPRGAAPSSLAAVVAVLALFIVRPGSTRLARSACAGRSPASSWSAQLVASVLRASGAGWSDVTLTDRPALWSVASDYIDRSPWFGHGPAKLGGALLVQRDSAGGAADRRTTSGWTSSSSPACVGAALFVVHARGDAHIGGARASRRDAGGGHDPHDRRDRGRWSVGSARPPFVLARGAHPHRAGDARRRAPRESVPHVAGPRPWSRAVDVALSRFARRREAPTQEVGRPGGESLETTREGTAVEDAATGRLGRPLPAPAPTAKRALDVVLSALVLALMSRGHRARGARDPGRVPGPVLYRAERSGAGSRLAHAQVPQDARDSARPEAHHGSTTPG